MFTILSDTDQCLSRRDQSQKTLESGIIGMYMCVSLMVNPDGVGIVIAINRTGPTIAARSKDVSTKWIISVLGKYSTDYYYMASADFVA